MQASGSRSENAQANAASATLSPERAGVGLGIYQLCFFLGAGFAPAISGAFLALREGSEGGAINPLLALHSSAAFSDALLVGPAALLCALFSLLAVKEVKENPTTDTAYEQA